MLFASNVCIDKILTDDANFESLRVILGLNPCEQEAFLFF